MKAELLAPAGSYEGLRAAIAAGADAVYIGGQRFGARAYAQNPGEDELLQAIDFVHLHGKKIYLTVNTLLKEQEISRELYDYLAPYYERGADAVIVQDLGAMSFIKKEFPGLPIHASTQMAITGPYGAELLKKAGVSRIVTARELSLEEIKGIRKKTGIEIESFIHGALCYSCSGMCLFSSMLGGRSGNRGRCAQPCRLPYEAYEGRRQPNKEEEAYLLSPKDMCTIDLLPEILNAGVFSLKIEGRMKKPEYAAGVTRIYRKYLDLLEQGKKYEVAKEDRKELLDLYQRDGFNRGYYQMHNGKEMMALRNEKKRGKSGEGRNEALFLELKKKYLETKIQERIYGNLILFTGSPAILNLEYQGIQVLAEGEEVLLALNQPLNEDRVRKQMLKTGNSPFWFERLDISMDEQGFLPMQSLNALRRRGMDLLEMEILKVYRRKLPRCAGESTLQKKIVQKNAVSCRMLASVESEEQLDAVCRAEDIEGIYCDWSMFPKGNFLAKVRETAKRIKGLGKEFYLMLPYLLRAPQEEGLKKQLEEAGEEADGFLVRNLEELKLLLEEQPADKIICDASVYTWNQEALEYIKDLGISRTTIPLELNAGEIRNRDNQGSDFVVYGRYPMMVSVQCLNKNLGGCDQRKKTVELKDRYGVTFLTKCVCDFCYNVIYNSVPTGLLLERREWEALTPAAVRLSFTTENQVQTSRILDIFVDRYKKNKEMPQELPAFTKGHYKRGVE